MKFNNMKNIILILFSIFSFSCNSQNYGRKPSIKKIIIDGNSILALGNGNKQNECAAVKACYDSLIGVRPPIYFFPISGKTVLQLCADFPSKVAPSISVGDVVVCNETTNDLYATRDATVTYGHILAYRDSVHAHGGKIVWVTMTAVYWSDYLTVDTDRLALNLLINNNSVQFDGVIDFGNNSNFNTTAATLNTTYFNADRVHYTDLGYRIFGKAIQLIIQPFFP